MIAIINYGLGNLTSILNMHKRLGIEAIITNDPQELQNADKLILPGVGHFDKGMQNLNQSGLTGLLNQLVLENKKTILGICLGAQLMTRKSEEGVENGLGWLPADTIRFNINGNGSLKVPHMGWTDLAIVQESPIWQDLPVNPRYYFVHTFHFKFDNASFVTGQSTYGYEFACAFQRENIYGVQFHPEKSHKFGMKLLENFARLQK
ncbi:imidazole glycerol phosphate synthase subunit HisH [Niastella vici]|uniref:Imidazole glycerol phosphate synthase subunit HisH n=1 Tax=Niastella vici TaxID=1703345 RepID=A0A1V9G8E5_9BACT|nr:imidazole glycerol phosphate synthase subunit HisH [Niastella vici]OQP66893.1 imidazole glycerol phosphate synthase subunit HisH [Niastella vici]